MQYRIESTGRKCCSIAANREELIAQLRHFKSGDVMDIRKLYKNGISDSVMEKYERYIGQDETPTGRRCRFCPK